MKKGYVSYILNDQGIISNYKIIDRDDGPYLLIKNFKTPYKITSFWYIEGNVLYDIKYIPNNKLNMLIYAVSYIDKTDKYIIYKGSFKF